MFHYQFLEKQLFVKEPVSDTLALLTFDGIGLLIGISFRSIGADIEDPFNSSPDLSVSQRGHGTLLGLMGRFLVVTFLLLVPLVESHQIRILKDFSLTLENSDFSNLLFQRVFGALEAVLLVNEFDIHSEEILHELLGPIVVDLV